MISLDIPAEITTSAIGRNMAVQNIAQDVTLAQIMRPDPVTIFDNETVGQAVEKMTEQGIRHLVVISPAGIVCGLISQRDTFRYLAENRNRVAMVRDAMTAPAICAPPDMSVSEAAQLMRKQRIGCLLIVSPSRKLLGIITRSDVLDFLTSKFLLSGMALAAGKSGPPGASARPLTKEVIV
jgi:IMP dehydrogenase